MELKVLTWNLNRASYRRRKLWSYMGELEFDAGFFQEVYMIPNEVRWNYHTFRGEMNTLLLHKDLMLDSMKRNYLQISDNHCIEDFYVSCRIEIGGNSLSLFSIYNYIGPADSDFSEFLDLLYNYIEEGEDLIIIGGDFNINKNFSPSLRRLALLAEEMTGRLSELGFRDVLREEEDPFTFMTPNGGKYQIDYLFVPEGVKILDVWHPPAGEIIETRPRLSDHIPLRVTLEI